MSKLVTSQKQLRAAVVRTINDFCDELDKSNEPRFILYADEWTRIAQDIASMPLDEPSFDDGDDMLDESNPGLPPMGGGGMRSEHIRIPDNGPGNIGMKPHVFQKPHDEGKLLSALGLDGGNDDVMGDAQVPNNAAPGLDPSKEELMFDDF